MARKRSPETELRRVKRLLKEQSAKLAALSEELAARRRIGAMMSNICYNLGNNEAGKLLGDHTQSIMRDMRENWDAIRREPI